MKLWFIVLVCHHKKLSGHSYENFLEAPLDSSGGGMAKSHKRTVSQLGTTTNMEAGRLRPELNCLTCMQLDLSMKTNPAPYSDHNDPQSVLQKWQHHPFLFTSSICAGLY